MALIAYLTARATWANSFQFRDFRLLWGSTFLHSLGMGMEQVALGWWVWEATESPFMVTMAFAARMAPFLFLGMLSGAIADQVDRRLFLLYLTLGGAVVAGLMALGLLSDFIRVRHVMALTVVGGCIWASMQTALHAYTYDIVGPRSALNGLSVISLGHRFGGVAGSFLAGAIIAGMSVGALYLVVSVFYIFAVAVLLGIRDTGQSALRQHQPVLKNLLDSIQLIRRNRVLLTLMALTATTEFFGFTHQGLLPVFADEVLGVGPLGLGFMTGLRQAAGVLGVIILVRLGDFRHKGLLMFIGVAAFGLGEMAFSLTTNLILFMVILTFVNASASMVDTLFKTLMQSNVADEERGRAMGSWVLSIGVAPLGFVSVGGLAGALGAQGALLVNGSILAFAGLASAIGLPRIRRLE